MRLFIALDFNELRDYFVELQGLLPYNSNLIFIRKFHLTLKFLGEIQQDRIETIIDNLKNVKFQSFSVLLVTIGTFPTEDYIRVVWIGLKPEEKIFELLKSIDESLKQFFKKERNFKAHITLARVKYLEDKKRFLEKIRKIDVENKKVEIKDFRLIKSTLTPKGPIYEDLVVFGSG